MSRGAFVNNSQFPSKFIRAGAGAGKTTALINSFFDFIEFFERNNKTLPRIIITTFTRKATQEVKERLLRQALIIDEKNGSNQKLFQYISKKSFVHISTIHGVLSLLLSRHHDLIGFSSDIKVTDNKILYKIYYQQLKNIFKNNSIYFELLENYSFKQLVQQAIKFHELAFEHPIQFVDKSILLSLRKEKINQAILDLESILIEKNKVISHKKWHDYFSYIENFLQKIKPESINFSELILFYSAKPKKPPFYQDKPLFESAINNKIDEYFSSKSNFINDLDTDEFISQHQNVNFLFHQMATEFHKLICHQKQKTGKISISDLETLSLKLITDFPIQTKAFSNQYDYFMVDEYQDTSPLQVKILNALIQNKSQFTVGDPQQSIYLFRGARSEVFLQKESDSKLNGHKLIQLQTNYRSDHKLMKCLNDITKNFSKQFSQMNPKDNTEAELALQTVIPQAFYVKSNEEYSALANHILALAKKGISFGDICILFTKNSDIINFAKFAIKNNIPIQSQIAAGFDQKREVIDLVSFLKFLVNPYDNLNILILLRSPWFEISDQQLFDLQEKNEHDQKYQSVWSVLKKVNNETSQNLLNYLSIYQEAGVLEALEKFIFNTGFLDYSQKIDSTGKREANIFKFIVNLKENINSNDFILNDYLSTQFSTFQDDLSSNLNESIPLFNGNRVSIMTVHTAKGLQFKHVLLAAVFDQPKLTNQLQFLVDTDKHLYSIPVLNSEMKLSWSSWGKLQKNILNEKESLEYERIFYVAVTRAEKSISFIADTNQKSFQNSWYSKLNWPELGLHTTDDYVFESIEYSNEVVPLDKNYSSNIKLRSKLNFTEGSVSATVSVTDLISNKSENNISEANKSEDIIKSDQILDHLSKAQKGTDLHRLFESAKFLPRDTVLKKSTADEEKALRWLFDLTEIPFEKILTEGFTEWGFGLQTKLGVLQGQIDLWCKLDNSIYILDYKTGSSYYSDKALGQLNIYAECLKKMKFINLNDEVNIVVLYPFEEKIVKKTILFSDIKDI